MPTANSRLRVRVETGVTLVEFIDRNILDEANIQAIGDEISGLVENVTGPKLLVSFRNVDHLSSAALGMLITIHNKVKARGGQLRLADIDPQILEVFKMTKLDRLFKIHDTGGEALKSFA